MSGQATGWALKHGPRPDHVDRTGVAYGQRARGLRAVLVTVADAANAQGQHAHPGIQNVCDGSLYGRRRAGIILAELVAEGWLAIETEGGGAGRATVYFLPRMSEENRALTAHPDEKEPRTPDDEPRIFEEGTAQSADETAHSGLRTNGLSTEKLNGLPQQKQRVGSSDADFIEFYEQVFPRKEARPKAYAAWVKARAKVDVDVILSGARRFRDDPNRLPQFTPHPATWLNDERWEDGPLPRRQGPGRPQPVVVAVDEDRSGESGRLSL